MKREETGNNSSGIVSVILGILSIVFTLNNGIILGIIGLFFAINQKKISDNRWARAGTILCFIGIILSVILIIAFYWLSQTHPEILKKILQDSLNNLGTS